MDERGGHSAPGTGHAAAAGGRQTGAVGLRRGLCRCLQKKRGMVRSVDVARHMEVSKPSVCHAVATLRDGGFIMMDEDHFLHLTDMGREVAEKIYKRHCFFTEQLITAGVDPKTAEADACRIEHIISDESFDRLKEAAEQEQN